MSNFGRDRLSWAADPRRTGVTLFLLLLVLNGTCFLFSRYFSLSMGNLSTVSYAKFLRCLEE